MKSLPMPLPRVVSVLGRPAALVVVPVCRGRGVTAELFAHDRIHRG